MADFFQIGAEFKRMHNSLRPRISSVLYVECRSLLLDFRERSPVDSGEYKSGWSLITSRFSAPNILSGYSLRNRTPRYGQYMEYGADVNSAPWYFPGKGKKRTGKLRVKDGKVWAGGLNPGHDKTAGGAIGPVLSNNKRRINSIAKKVADAVIGGFK